MMRVVFHSLDFRPLFVDFGFDFSTNGRCIFSECLRYFITSLVIVNDVCEEGKEEKIVNLHGMGCKKT